jgi:hypothetical protein
MEEERDYIAEAIIERLRDVKIDCPDCADMYSDDQYTCTTCWCEGGQGTLGYSEWKRYVIEYLKY